MNEDDNGKFRLERVKGTDTYSRTAVGRKRLGVHFMLRHMSFAGQIYISGESHCFNPLTAKLFNWNFHALEVVSR